MTTVTPTRATAEGIQNVLTDIKEGADNLFDRVWIGEPRKIPFNQTTGVVRAAEDTGFEDAACRQTDHYRRSWFVTLYVKGEPEIRELRGYDVRDLVKGAFKATPTMCGSCTYSGVDRVLYGEYGTDTQLLNTVRLFVYTDHDETIY